MFYYTSITKIKKTLTFNEKLFLSRTNRCTTLPPYILASDKDTYIFSCAEFVKVLTKEHIYNVLKRFNNMRDKCAYYPKTIDPKLFVDEKITSYFYFDYIEVDDHITNYASTLDIKWRNVLIEFNKILPANLALTSKEIEEFINYEISFD